MLPTYERSAVAGIFFIRARSSRNFTASPFNIHRALDGTDVV